MSEEEAPQQPYMLEDCDVFHKVFVWLQFQSRFIEENPRETWSPAPPVTPPPPPARSTKSPKPSPRYSPYFVRDGPRSPVILFNEPPRAPTPDEVLPPPPQPPILGPLPPIAEILGLSVPQHETNFVVRDSPESPTYIVRDSPESPNSESWKFDPIFNWQKNADRKSSSYENTNPEQLGPSDEEDPESNLCHCRECLVFRSGENQYAPITTNPSSQAVQEV